MTRPTTNARSGKASADPAETGRTRNQSRLHQRQVAEQAADLGDRAEPDAGLDMGHTRRRLDRPRVLAAAAHAPRAQRPARRNRGVSWTKFRAQANRANRADDAAAWIALVIIAVPPWSALTHRRMRAPDTRRNRINGGPRVALTQAN
jgi:hypothetical protein